MIKEQYQTLYAYGSHTVQTLLDKAALLDEGAYHAHPGYGHGSIHDLFYHLLVTLRGWRIALETGTQPARPKPTDFAGLQAVTIGLAEEGDSWQRLLAGPIVLMTARGEKANLIDRRVLQHLVLHSMQHHTEVAKLLTDKGQSPGDIDFLFYND